MTKIAIIAGSGFDNPQIFKNSREQQILTPYDQTPVFLKIGQIENVETVLLARHGQKHTIPPTQINFRANIYALKQANCSHILATTAVGSLKEEIKPGDLVVLDQFIDFTKHRLTTFYEKFEAHQPIHTAMAEPFSTYLRQLLIETSEELNLRFHHQGTVVTIEGPRFSTKAESKMFKTWGADVINMSIAPEVILANELNIPYAAVAMSTDYDCWKEDEETVTWEKVLEIFKQNAEKVTKLLLKTIPKIKSL